MTEYGMVMDRLSVLGLVAGRKRVERKPDHRWMRLNLGDVIWVKETLCRDWAGAAYLADKEPVVLAGGERMPWRWPFERLHAMYMPPSAARFRLGLLQPPRLERLWMMTPARVSGEARIVTPGVHLADKVDAYRLRWDREHPATPWETNPIIVRLDFKIVSVAGVPPVLTPLR